MKLYQINVVCETGSTGRIVTDIYKTMIDHGDECRIAYGRGSTPDGISAFKIETRLGIYSHVLMTRLTDRHGLYSKHATKTLIKDIKQYQPDIIHLHNIHGYYLNYEMLFTFLKEYAKPVIWTLHDCWAFTGHCAYFDAVECEKWKNGCGKCCQLRAYPSSFGKDASEESYTRKMRAFLGVGQLQIVTVSYWLKGVVEHSFLSKYPVRAIYNGIDLREMHITDSNIRQQYGLTQKYIVLGVASVWDKRKGLDLFRKISERLPDEYKIVLIGVSERQKKDMPERILCIGKQSYSDLAKWYSAADVYVNGSVEETMGLTTLESMACGTPVVVQNTTAVPEVVGEGCGVVVEKQDIDGVVKAILELQKTEDVTMRCIARASEFEKQKQYDIYYEVYQSLLQ